MGSIDIMGKFPNFKRFRDQDGNEFPIFGVIWNDWDAKLALRMFASLNFEVLGPFRAEPDWSLSRPDKWQKVLQLTMRMINSDKSLLRIRLLDKIFQIPDFQFAFHTTVKDVSQFGTSFK